ncbi:MAG: hypothetical protein K2O12_04900, partial [Muribaculaceae bacterium]|nr:hypothetical protein [Muribaculaceae bacterium]
MENTFHIRQFDGSSKDVIRLGDDYLIVSIDGNVRNPDEYFASPVRFYGLTLFLCKSGSLDVEVNFERYNISSGSIFVVEPSSLVRTCGSCNVKGDMLFISTPFLHDVNFDMQALHQTMVLKENRVPHIVLSDKECSVIDMYFQLMRHNAGADEYGESPLSKNIARSLVSAILYQLMLVLRSRRDSTGADTAVSNMSTRRLNYVHEFGGLVHKYYRRERSVAFYASKLFISPKYLSLLVKEATGRTADAWIDEYVIMEAKNMLRFSGRSIQQI